MQDSVIMHNSLILVIVNLIMRTQIESYNDLMDKTFLAIKFRTKLYILLYTSM